ncbi:MAG: ABC1 kinase family protein [Myxococcota bacterium]
MGALHGLPQKVGQLLALGELERGDAVFSALTEGGEALPPAQAAHALEATLGRPIDTVFQALELEAVPASLGQVHRGTLWDGRRVAVKLQYPGIADAVKVDLGALGLLGRAFQRGYDLRAYRATVGEMIHRELDYRLEAQALSHFGALVSDDPRFRTPTLVPELSNERLLVMTWLDGVGLDAARAWPAEARADVARALIRLFLRSVLEWGVVHADLHAGNVRLERTATGVRLGLLDFGCVQSLDAPVAGGLRLLLEGVTTAPHAPPEHWLARWEAVGFSRALLTPVQDELGAVSRLLLEPLLSDAPFDATRWELNARFKALLGERRFAFRFAAPASFLFVTRAFVTLVQTLKALDAPVAWRPVLAEVAGRSTLAPPPSLRLSHAAREEPPAVKPLARHLRIRVSKPDGTRIELTFGAEATPHLPGLVPPEVLPRLAARRLDVDAITAAALARRCAPGPLFDLQEPEREMRVWLE